MTIERDALPSGFAKKKISLRSLHPMKSRLRHDGLNTVCEEARCPNIAECFGASTATFLLMGRVCSRGCSFCSVTRGAPAPQDPGEISRLVEAVRIAELRYAVLTSVTRDDLADGGAAHLATAVRRVTGETRAVVELLFPDMSGREKDFSLLLDSPAIVFNHNIEMVERLYPLLRVRADYRTSLGVLSRFGRDPRPVKTGFMVGLGETREELERLIGDVASSGVRILTIGQYLQPTRQHAPVVRYYGASEFEDLAVSARSRGIPVVASGPFVRSSYRAEELFRSLVNQGN